MIFPAACTIAGGGTFSPTVILNLIQDPRHTHFPESGRYRSGMGPESSSGRRTLKAKTDIVILSRVQDDNA
jgi:hypothetical protein